MAAAALNVSASVASSSADKFWPCRSACLGRVKEEDDEEEGAGAWGVGGGVDFEHIWRQVARQEDRCGFDQSGTGDGVRVNSLHLSMSAVPRGRKD